MTEPTRNDPVLLLVKKATDGEKAKTPGVMGKKALQKSMYFFNEAFNLLTFKWKDHGPFSGEIQQTVRDFVSNKRIKVEDLPAKKDGIHTRSMTFVKSHNQYFAEIKFPEQADKKMNEMVHFTSGR